MLCIQEHWYFSYEKNDLINISSTHETQAKSVDDYTEKENFIHGRGYGGVAIFWRKDIDHEIKSHDDGNERINVISQHERASSMHYKRLHAIRQFKS